MSNRYNPRRQESSSTKNYQKKFVPKSQNPSPSPNPTSLSSSLRQSPASQSSTPAATATRGSAFNGLAIKGKFVKYLPLDEAVAAGLKEGGLDPVESQRVVDLLNKELSCLLKLSPRDFWREVATDASLHDFLDSFLQFRSRWYDFPHHGAKAIVAGVVVGEIELTRRVFMVLYRISSNREPGARASDYLSSRDHSVLLQEKKLLDLPKLLDVCAIYGHENEDLTKLVVGNAIKAQPWIHDSLVSVISHVMNIIHTMYQRCNSSLEGLLSSGNSGRPASIKLLTDYLEVMDFVNDAVVSMDSFVCAYKPAAIFFCCPVEISKENEELLCTLARFHDLLLPSLQRGFQILYTELENELQKTYSCTISDIACSLKMLSIRLVKFGWSLLDSCYLSDELSTDNIPLPDSSKIFPRMVEDPGIRADILIQTFREISGISSQVLQSQNNGTFLQEMERKYCIISRLESLQRTGWIFMEDEQLQYLSGITMHTQHITSKELSGAQISSATNGIQKEEDNAIMESKISQIKDLFPDYGQGFLSACLEVYNQDPEEVIQRILEGTLHQDLQSLDTSLEKIPPRKPAPANRKDKGKGILVEPVGLPSRPAVDERKSEYPQISSSSSGGRYVRKSDADFPSTGTLDSKDESYLAKTAALITQYEYDDEYDDSFDDLGLSVADSGLEESESMGDTTSSNDRKVWNAGNDNSAPSNSARWGSRKKPQFYVKDGKNYSYKVEGSIAVANSSEASIVNQAQKETIHGLGRGGNLPLGAVKKLTEAYREEQVDQNENTETAGRGNPGGARGRGRRGGGRNNYRKDRAMKKHFAGLGGY